MMDSSNREPTLEDLLADSIVQLVMRRDDVVPDEVRQIVHEAWVRRDLWQFRPGRDRLRWSPSGSACAASWPENGLFKL
ncbi:hypothetical protein B6S44_07765 [Bosea sp. Tri-44]|nr:hypothetical protein B6S44_07765 [Bosea sp. Tri-44]